MKKILLITSMMAASCLFVQEASAQDYNKWSIEAAGGMHKPVRPMAKGYYTDTPSFAQFSLGTRYMFNNRFGLKLDLGYNSFKEGDGSSAYKSNYYRGTLQGVANLGSILKFETWTNSLGVLLHAGAGYSQLKPKEPIDRANTDQMLNFIAGITPQVKLGNRVALNLDASIIGHVRQNYTFDGTKKTNTRGFNGYFTNFSAGLTVYLGKHEQHADWVSDSGVSNDLLEDLDSRISNIETDMIDSDQDGVPDYLDREPNTPSGVAVDTKGRAIDKNENGIPDEIESALDARYARKGEAAAGSGGDIVERLIDEGYVNVYFQFNSTKPETYSLEAINYLIKYMNDNPSAKAELIGYADEIGNPDYNKTLSEKRAKAVYDILVASGVSGDRLTYTGNGEDSSVDKSSSPARQLVRRVTFKLSN
ncbi:MAG TPA: OmpA family protein [Aequorivita sp.]|nr:OmpA family protein [Aequorivita sp.]